MPLTIVKYPHPALRYPTVPIQQVTDEVRQLAADMIETMYANNGVGLAAPQVGYPWKLFVCNPKAVPGEEMVFVNPTVESRRHRTVKLEEGCLSIPGLYREVTRPSAISVTWEDLSGRACKAQYVGWFSRVVQHEYDHLVGKLFIDYLEGEYAEGVQEHLQTLYQQYDVDDIWHLQELARKVS